MVKVQLHINVCNEYTILYIRWSYIGKACMSFTDIIQVWKFPVLYMVEHISGFFCLNSGGALHSMAIPPFVYLLSY